MHIHSNIIILRFMHVHGRRYIVYTLLFIQDCSFTNGYAFFGPYLAKKLYRIRIQIPLLTKKILSRTKREQEPYFLKKTTAEREWYGTVDIFASLIWARKLESR